MDYRTANVPNIQPNPAYSGKYGPPVATSSSMNNTRNISSYSDSTPVAPLYNVSTSIYTTKAESRPIDTPGTDAYSKHDMTTRGYDIYVNVYDLIPSNKYFHWTFAGFYHSGVQISSLEWAFGGHELSFTGVFPMKPREIPVEGVKFYREVHMGRCNMTLAEIARIIDELADEYRGNTYHLLKRNCNHFTYDLCLRLVGRGAPGWINRLAFMGTKVPCINQVKWLGFEQAEEAERRIVEEKAATQVGWRKRLAASVNKLVDRASEIVSRGKPETTPNLQVVSQNSVIVPNAPHDGRYVISIPPTAASANYTPTETENLARQLEKQKAPTGLSEKEVLARNGGHVEKPKTFLAALMHNDD